MEYLSSINTPKLYQEEKDKSEIPGNNRLTRELYLALFDLLGPTRLECLNHTFLLCHAFYVGQLPVLQG